jgi:hypothetical protein
MERGQLDYIEIHYYASPPLRISQNEIDNMIKAKDAIEMLSYALKIASELNRLNKKEN